MENIVFDNIGETLKVKRYENGLTVILVQKNDFNKVHASVTTKFGSINSKFNINGEEHKINDGVAHFLEHKMFEKEDGDSFTKFSQYGGSANAYTSFDHTCYYFTATENFKENFEILLSMTSIPYFTDDTVEKEKGIISEELKMYDDDASWILYYETLKNLYKEHPLRIDIGGTIESINKISKEELYLCYNTFYHPRNLLITVVGNFEEESCLELVDKYYSNVENKDNVSIEECVDIDINNKSSVVKLDINIDKCSVGYKLPFKTEKYDAKREMAIGIFLDMIFGKSSSNYEMFAEKGIYPSYSYSEISNTGYAMISSDVYNQKEFFSLVDEALKSDLKEEDFNLVKKMFLGTNIRIFNQIDGFAKFIIDTFVNNITVGEMISIIENLTFEELLSYRKQLFKAENRTEAVVEKA